MARRCGDGNARKPQPASFHLLPIGTVRVRCVQDHTPRGRGYQTNLFYFHHDNDYWSMAYDVNCNGTVITDLWHTPTHDGGEGPAIGMNSTCIAHQPSGPRSVANGCDGGPLGDHWCVAE